MRRPWTCDNWNNYIPVKHRSGIRLRFDKDVDPEVKRAVKQFVNWLREWYEFPIRVPIYLRSTEYIRSREGDLVSATFLGSYDISEEPYIKVSVGDYCTMLEEVGKDNALAGIICSIAHELTHYFQWIKFHDIWMDLDERKSERQALYYARAIVDDYHDYYDHP